MRRDVVHEWWICLCVSIDKLMSVLKVKDRHEVYGFVIVFVIVQQNGS